MNNFDKLTNKLQEIGWSKFKTDQTFDYFTNGQHKIGVNKKVLLTDVKMGSIVIKAKQLNNIWKKTNASSYTEHLRKENTIMTNISTGPLILLGMLIVAWIIHYM